MEGQSIASKLQCYREKKVSGVEGYLYRPIFPAWCLLKCVSSITGREKVPVSSLNWLFRRHALKTVTNFNSVGKKPEIV